jgi:hypothetical protein
MYMVLGVQWPESLGPILWDFGHRTMALVWNDLHICWSAEDIGDGQATLLTAQENLMEEPSVNFLWSLCHR